MSHHRLPLSAGTGAAAATSNKLHLQARIRNTLLRVRRRRQSPPTLKCVLFSSAETT